MVECTFCDGHGTAELNVYEQRIEETVTLFLCSDCLEKYDKGVETFATQETTGPNKE